MIHLINKKDNIFDDNIAFVENWDFSRANVNDDSRILTITKVASICYQSPKGEGSISLYNKLLSEGQGLPSSSFEFVPVLLTYDEYVSTWSTIFDQVKTNSDDKVIQGFTLNIEKYGEWVEEGQYLLTNYRAVLHDKETFGIDLTKRYNTDFECIIIAKHFKVFNFKVDMPTRSQMVRHRVNWQELSRRYVSGDRVSFEFYISDKMKNVWSNQVATLEFGGKIEYTSSTQNVIDNCLKHYFKALEDGVKPQEARRIIPQAAYSNLWGAFMPSQLDNYLKLRSKSDSQYEIRQTAIAIKELVA